MKKTDFVRIINEELKDFDFLGNDQNQKEKELIDLLSNPDFQKQFICDFLLGKKDKYKITKVTDSSINDWRHDGHLNITYGVEISYYYDKTKEPARFGLWFEGNNIGYHVDSDYDPGVWRGTMPDSTAPSGGDWFDEISWKDIPVQMFMIDGRDDKIEFTAFEKAPERIQNMFVSHFLSDFIYENGNIGVETPEQNDKIQNTGYC